VENVNLSNSSLRTVTVLAVLLTVAWAVFRFLPQSDVSYEHGGGLREYSGTHTVEPEKWAELVTTGGPGPKPWVLLPPDYPGENFVSGVEAEDRGFLAPDVCAECHRDKFETFQETTHALTSQLPSSTSILGKFTAPENVLETSDAKVSFLMEKTESGFLQHATVRDEVNGRSYTETFSFDLILGSGNHGQSYLYWNRDRLYQMHVSYLSESKTWVNSPGPYFDGTIDYARPVPPRCLDCHATWIAFDAKEVNRFERSTLIPGVTCVRCHGPGHEHVAFHRQNPEAKEGKRIVHPGKLSVTRVNELCAQCHSSGEQIGAAFGYRPGELLEAWMEVDLNADAENNADPHSANQLARLMQSPCFTKSEGLSCVRCHDPHRSQLGQMKTYAAKCRECHQPADCGECRSEGPLLEDRCVECHMPARRDAQVRIQTTEGRVEALLRNHRIGVWPETAQQVKALLMQQQGDKVPQPHEPARPPE